MFQWKGAPLIHENDIEERCWSLSCPCTFEVCVMAPWEGAREALGYKVPMGYEILMSVTSTEGGVVTVTGLSVGRA